MYSLDFPNYSSLYLCNSIMKIYFTTKENIIDIRICKILPSKNNYIVLAIPNAFSCTSTFLTYLQFTELNVMTPISMKFNTNSGL